MNLSDSIKNLKNKIEDINNKVKNLIKLSNLANAKAKDNETKVENIINTTYNNLKNINENMKKINIINDELYSTEDTFLKLTNTNYVGKTTNFIDVYPSKFMIFGGAIGNKFTGSAEDWDDSSQKALIKIKISNKNETKDLVYKIPSTLKNIGNIAFDRLDLVNMKLYQKCDMLKLTGSESWERDTTVTHSKKNTITFKTSIDGKGALKPSNNDKEAVAVSNNNDFIVYSCNILNENDIQCFCFTQGGLLKIQIKRSSLATQDVDGFKTWLSTANLAIFFEKESESVADITGEKIKLCPNATIEMTNAVKPSKVEIKYKGSVVKAFEDIADLDTNKQDKTDNALDTTDKTVVGAINEVNGNSLDNITFSADYKNIIINRKNGTNPYKIPISAIIHNAKLIELNDIDATNIGDGRTLVYDGATKKHKYVSSTGTDELVKMDSTTDSKHLSELIDKSTVVNDNGVLKVKKLDGQEVTIAEINHLKGLTMNVMDLVNSFANGGVKVYEHTIPTYADLSTLDRSKFIDGIKYFVYVLADETHGGAKTTYLCDKKNTTYFCVSGDHRDFTTSPIDLANEVTGKLGTANIDVNALWKLLTINDTYKTLTTKNEVFGTHGAKALYDELVTSIGKKANATDLTTHTGDTNIHVTTSDKTKWNKIDNKVNKTDIIDNLTSTNTDKPLSAKQGKVLKGEVDKKANDNEVIKKTDITTTINSASTASQVPSAKSVYDNAIKCNNIKTYYTLAQLGITSATCTIKNIWDKMPANSIGVIDTNSSIVTDLAVFAPALNITDGQNVYGFLTIGKFTERTILEFRRAHSESAITPETFIGYCIGKNCTSIDWKQMILCPTKNNSSSVTTITFSATTNYKPLSSFGLSYYILNGVCYISGGVDCVKPSSSLVKLATISKPRFSYVYAKGMVVNGTAADNTHLTICVDSSGSLQLQNGLAGGSYRFTFSYPIA